MAKTVNPAQPQMNHEPLVLQNVSYKIMVLRKRRQIIMPSTMYAYECDDAWIQCLEFFAVADGYQPILCAMQNIRMAIYHGYPFVGTQMIP